MGKEVYCTGRFIRIARIKDEDYGDDLKEPEKFINALCESKDFKVDIFTLPAKSPA
jgi:hypothetical protein